MPISRGIFGLVVSILVSIYMTSGALAAAELEAHPTDPTYAALRAARPDGRTIAVANLTLVRDVFRFDFARGTFHLLAPVDGRTVGAVFLGEGTLRLDPATPGERRRLAIASGAEAKNFESLSDRFSRLVLLFGDDTAAELARAAPAAPIVAGTPDAKAREAFEDHLKRQRKDYRTNFHLRLLADLLDAPGTSGGAFLAFLEGDKTGPALAAVDPRGADAIGVGGQLGREDALLYVPDTNRGGAWYLAETKAEIDSGRRSSAWRAVDAEHYEIETTVAKDADVAGTTTLRFKAAVPGVRVLPLTLQSELRVESARLAPEGEETWTDLPFVQEAEKEDADLAVVLPRALAAGEMLRLELTYKGDKVLVDMGEKNYAVLSRVGWYPNVGFFNDPATFDLTYRIPAGNEVISVGDPVSTRTEGKQTIAVWSAKTPIQVAGFNYGKFKKHAKKDEVSGVGVEVWTNPGTPDIVREINALFASGDDSGIWGEGAPSLAGGGGGLGKVNTERLAESALADGLNSARLFATYFGKLPFARVAITQQSQWTFGQSWPALIYMPYLSFLDGTQRQRLGLARANDFVESVGFHEFAHQWWGHLLGWESYRDQWLSEGFAEFSAALALEHTKGKGEYDRFWREARRRIVEKFPGNALAPYQAGAITDGYRAATERTPMAGFSLIYEKGGYVLHMLRMAMYDGRSKDPDASFIAMMKDFTATYGGKNPSTADFQGVVERHLTPSLDATRNGKVDWFFRQWVDGTEIPKLAADLKIESAPDGYRVRGQVSQAEVPSDFRTLVPLYLEFDKNQFVQFGLLPLVGATTVAVDVVVKPPKKPHRALINARGEVLARD